MQGTFLSFNISTTDNILELWLQTIIFLRCFHSICFYNSSGFRISSFVVFHVWLPTYYFYFSSKAHEFFFFFNHCFHFVIYPRRLPIAEDPVLKIIEKYKNHSNIIAFKNIFASYSFDFKTVSRDAIFKK